MSEWLKDLHRNLSYTFSEEFPSYTQIRQYMSVICSIYKKNARLVKLGVSHENRPIEMIILQADQSKPKNGVMIEGGIHAREWLSHTTVLFVIDDVLRTGQLLKYMDVYVIPCLNPDGYEFSRTGHRFWRKNMNRNGFDCSQFWGVDLNRNFSYKFGCKGSSGSPSSSIYCGKEALSEPEARCLELALKNYGRRIKLYLSVHSYGSLILYPWGHTRRLLLDKRDLVTQQHACARKARRAMRRFNPGSCFKIGSLSKMTYVSSGNTSDYVRAVHGIKFTFTIELPRGNRSGFDATPSQIIQVASEVMVGIRAMVKFVHRYYKRKQRRLFYKLPLNRKRPSGSPTGPACKRRRTQERETYPTGRKLRVD